ncbi:AAA family ATPase [Streptomyces sp. NPDC002896]|uniref:AAA family ATPase n=1 Tax=Streptomyces sp. NPDC002896 TaxID=3154438 RepID=UPI003332F87E
MNNINSQQRRAFHPLPPAYDSPATDKTSSICRAARRRASRQSRRAVYERGKSVDGAVNLSTGEYAIARIPGHDVCHRVGCFGAHGVLPGSGGELMRGAALPVLWLCGPPGVGKTTVAWEMYSHLMQAGIETAVVDIDQLGICYPEPAADPGRHRMQARNLDAVAAAFRAAGARCLIVSGVVDTARGVHVGEIPRAAVTVCRLRADRDELRQRFTSRGEPAELVDHVLREADVLDASTFADACVDTSGLSVNEVAWLVRERTRGWPTPTQGCSADADEPTAAAAVTTPDRSQASAQTVPMAAGPVLWLCGATGVGKSTVGFEVYQRVLRAGVTAAYIDLDQLGFCHPVPHDDPGNHRVKSRNVAAVWGTYRAAGAQCLIMTGPVENEVAVKAYADALPAAELTLCRLHAEREQLTKRIKLRGRGGGSWAQPGDPLRGQSVTRLLQIADQAVASDAALEDAGIGDLRIDTDAHTVEQVADALVAQVALPGLRSP